MNKVILLGNLTKDPEIRSTQTGKKVASFAMAINDGKDANGQELVQYFNLSAGDKTAEIIEKYVKKGHKIMVIGKLKNRSWDKPDGTKGYATDVLVTEMEMLTSKSDAERINASMGSSSSSSQSDDDSSTTSKPKSKKVADDLPEIDINNLDVQMPF